MAWNSGTRCGLCSRFFCCPRHRLDHQSKAHGDVYSKEGQNLLQYFQRRAEIIVLRSRKTNISADGGTKSDTACCIESENSSNNNNEVPGLKRGHQRPILTESYSSIFQRKILIPKYRFRCSKQLSSFNSTSKMENVTSKVTNENRSLNGSGRTLKTSTPIVKALSEQSNWDEISPASTISDLLTPVEVGEIQRGKRPTTPLRSIMAKMSKYQSLSSGESGTHGRRVTFSLSGQLSLSGAVSASTSGSTLQSINEVEDQDGPDATRDEEKDFEECLPHDSLHCAVHSELHLQSSTVHEHYIIKDSLADSPPTPQEVGFFSCITGMFCSAIQTIPALSSLRNSYRNQPKRSRSPDHRAVEEDEVPHKKPCLTCDLRENPIKCRKPISSTSLKNGWL